MFENGQSTNLKNEQNLDQPQNSKIVVLPAPYITNGHSVYVLIVV